MKLSKRQLDELITNVVKSYEIVREDSLQEVRGFTMGELRKNAFAILKSLGVQPDDKKLQEVIAKLVEIIQATNAGAVLAEADNPFAKPEGGEEEKKEEPKKEKPKEPAGIPVKFDIVSVKRYNKALFKSDSGVVKSLDKKGVVVTVQPDGVDVLVNFTDIL